MPDLQPSRVLVVAAGPVPAELARHADVVDPADAVEALRAAAHAGVLVDADLVASGAALPAALAEAGAPVVVVARLDEPAVDVNVLVEAVTGRGRPRPACLAQTVRYAERVLAGLAGPAIVRDLDGRIVAATPSVEAVLGARRDADGCWPVETPVLQEPDGRPVPLDDRPFARVLRSGRAERGRLLRVVLPDGTHRWCEADASPVRGDDGVPCGVVLSFTDVTAEHRSREQVRLAATLLDAVGQAVIATDVQGTVTFLNAGAEALYGWPKEQALGRPVREVTGSVPTEQSEEILLAVRAGLSWTGDFPLRRRDGTAFTALCTTRPLLDDDGELVGMIGVSTDITERVAAEAAARLLSAVVDSTADAVVLTTPDGTVQAWNAAAEQMYGWTAEEAVGRHLSFVVPPERHAAMQQDLDQVLVGQALRHQEVQGVRRDGTVIDVALTVSPVRDTGGAVVGISTLARDMTERRAWEQALDRARHYDTLTGLPNRAQLGARLGQLVDGTPACLLLLDLDGFKDVNDAEGHALGDELLVAVARRLVAAVRPGDVVARFDGDAFAVLLPGTWEDEALSLAEGLIEEVREPLAVGGRTLHVSASIGLAASPACPVSDLLRAADAAVYDAKRTGRGRVRSFARHLSTQAEQRLRLSAALRFALVDGGLHVEYQPVVELATGRVLGVEALVRWRGGDGQLVPPNAFVPVAESTGLGHDLDRWVLHRACAEFTALRRDGVVDEDAHVAVNVTATDVVDPRFPGVVREALARTGLPAAALVLEVTETGVMADLDHGARTLGVLAELGVRIAIDDFGTGWSSLTYVRRLPASILKLDRSFVSRLDVDDDDLAIAASVVELGRATGKTVVAEGVETAAQLAVLRRLGCPAGQGSLWSPATSADGLADALRPVPSRRPPSARTSLSSCWCPPLPGAPRAAGRGGGVLHLRWGRRPERRFRPARERLDGRPPPAEPRRAGARTRRGCRVAPVRAAPVSCAGPAVLRGPSGRGRAAARVSGPAARAPARPPHRWRTHGCACRAATRGA